MKITIVTSEYSLEGGGLSYSCVQFQLLLEEIGHDVSILSSSLSDNNVIRGGYNKKLGRQLAYEAKLKQDEKSIVDTQLLIAFGGGFNGYYSSLLSRKTNKRFWLMLRGSDANLAKWDYEMGYYLDYSITRAERTICLSKELATNVELLTNKRIKADIIPNYAYRLTKSVKPFSYSRLCIGCGASHMNEKKGISNLIELIASYNNTYKEKIYLEIVGSIDEDVLSQYYERINLLRVEPYISFLGVKTREEFRSIQAGWHIYIQTSICEGMGNSVVDSMSLGIPVMITNTGYIAEYVKELFPQMIFSSFDSTIMAKELHHILYDPKSQEKYQRIYDSFFIAISKKVIKEVWSNLLSKKDDRAVIREPDTIISISLHDVEGEKHDNITTPIEVFRKFCEDVNIAGYKLCSMREYLSLHKEEQNRSIVCTFDDGYTGLLHNAMPIMNKYGYTATVFICSEYIGKINDWNCKDKAQRMHLSFSELKTLQNNGWEIGSHGVTHRSLLRLNETEIEIELSESKNILESKFGTIQSYAYPYGDYNNYIMRKVGNYYDYAFLLTQGGVFLSVDSLRIHRYYISEIYQIINNK